MPHDLQDGYQEWNRQRDTLRRLIQAACETSASVDETVAANLREADAQLHRDSFRIMLLGAFSSGKSTLINAMVGVDDMLPSGPNPLTAFITVLQWGEEPKAQMYRLDDAGVEIPDPEPISIEEFRRLVRLVVGADGFARQTSPYCRATVSVPLSLLANGVELIDCAGVDDDLERENVTLGLLVKTDAVIFVTPAVGGFGSQDRDKYLPLVQSLGHVDLFFVVNKFDTVRKADEKADVRQRALALAGRFTTDPERRVFCVSAIDALEARIGAVGRDRLESSGVPALERALADFLQHDRLRVKLGRPAVLLHHQILTLRDRIRDQRGMLGRDADELNAAFRAQAPARALLEAQRKTIATDMRNWTDETLSELAQAAEAFYRVQANDVTTWVNELERTEKIKVWTLRHKENLKKVAEEINQGLTRRQLEGFTRFLDGQFASLARQREDDLKRRLGPALEDYVANIRKLRDELSSPEVTPGDGTVVAPVSVSDRILGGLLGVMLPGLPGFVGAQFGTREMIAAAGPVVAGAVAAHVLALAHPVTAIAAIIAGALGSGRIAQGRVDKKVRTKLANAYADALRADAAELGRRFADGIKPTLTTWRKKLDAALEDEERAMVEDVERALATLTAKETDIRGRQHQLDQAEKALGRVDRDLSDFTAALHGTNG